MKFTPTGLEDVDISQLDWITAAPPTIVAISASGGADPTRFDSVYRVVDKDDASGQVTLASLSGVPVRRPDPSPPLSYYGSHVHRRRLPPPASSGCLCLS